MKKEEVIHLHTILYQFKKFFIENGLTDDSFFEEYNRLMISPSQIHRHKEDHKKAVFILAKELSNVLRAIRIDK